MAAPGGGGRSAAEPRATTPRLAPVLTLALAVCGCAAGEGDRDGLDGGAGGSGTAPPLATGGFPAPLDASSGPGTGGGGGSVEPLPLDAEPPPIDGDIRDAIPPAPDAEPNDPDAAELDCAALAGGGRTVCEAVEGGCGVVFEDGAGCAITCAAAGLECVASFENLEGACGPDLGRPQLGCRETGHDSDYCVCGPEGVVVPPEARPWEGVIGTAVGYGREATGGLGGDVCWVESLDDDGAGTLRDCATRDTPTWVRFRVSGNIDLRTLIDVSSNTTIDGRGAEITIRNRGLRLNRVRNVVLLYLKFDDGGGDNEDALQILNETEHVWVDHVTLEDFTDGLLDITRGSRFVTVSWCHFRDHDKTMLIGANPDHEDDRRIRVTVHHSWFERTNQRHPRLRCGKVHIFNTYYDRWGLYVMGSSLRGQIRSQRNVFEAERSTEATKVIVGDDPDDGDLRSDNDERRNGARIVERDPEDVFDPRDDYPYELEDAGDALVDRIRTGAGWRQVPLP